MYDIHGQIRTVYSDRLCSYVNTLTVLLGVFCMRLLYVTTELLKFNCLVKEITVPNYLSSELDCLVDVLYTDKNGLYSTEQ